MENTRNTHDTYEVQPILTLTIGFERYYPASFADAASIIREHGRTFAHIENYAGDEWLYSFGSWHKITA